MKFSEIKQFPFSSYRVNISWGYLRDWLDNQKDTFDLQIDPPFQRGYKWTIEQKTAYIEYQLRGGFSGKDIFWNCPNWMAIIDKHSNELQLVDGKQRVNAVLEFMDDKVPVFGGFLFSQFEDKFPPTKYDFIFHVNNLVTQEEVVDWYLGLNTGGSIHTEEDLQSAYDYIEELKKKK